MTITDWHQLAQHPCLILDFAEYSPPLLLSAPRTIWQATTPEQVVPTLDAAHQAAQSGAWVGGFIAYEAAAAWGLPTTTPQPGLPLVWLAEFASVTPWHYPELPVAATPPHLTLPLTAADYQQKLATIQEAIHSGASYQVNLTLAATLPPELELNRLFQSLQSRQRFPWAAWCHTGEVTIASFSPELFLSVDGAQLATGPIKGTRPVAPELGADLANLAELLASPKDGAEHVMIVDMARNDLGRLARSGSVQVERLQTGRSFPTVHHLESRIRATLATPSSLGRIMEAMFPAASITGAPKHHTMELIRQLEATPRGVYTGAIGVLDPAGRMRFNVAIRTLTRVGSEAPRLGLGGGIVADSQPRAEWEELHHKAAFLVPTAPPLHLLETLRVAEDGGCVESNSHLERLRGAAQALGFHFPGERLPLALEELARELTATGQLPRVVRVELAADGEFTLTTRPLVEDPPGLRVRIARYRVDEHDQLLRYKTTRRAHLERELLAAQAEGWDEVLFCNRAGVITEGALRSVMVETGAGWWTSPVSAGLLPGIWRARMIRELGAAERNLTLADLTTATTILMGNAARGTTQVVELVDANRELVWEKPSR